jgi:hypothetical protein
MKTSQGKIAVLPTFVSLLNFSIERIIIVRFSKTINHLKKEVIMFAAVRHYHFKPEDGEKIDKLVQEGFVPLLKKAKGFVRILLDSIPGNGEGASMSVFKDKAWC